MDVYSLGLLILWILCCNTSHSLEPQSQVIGTASSSDDALTFAEENLRFMQIQHKTGLKEFFRKSLNRNATDRCADVRHLQEILLREKYYALDFNASSANID